MKGFFFSSVREIIYADQEWDWAQNNDLGLSSLDRERRCKDSIECHTLATRVEKVSKSYVELGESKQFVQGSDPVYVELGESKQFVQGSDPVWFQIDDLRWGCWRNGRISHELHRWIPWPCWLFEVSWLVSSLGDQFWHRFYVMQWFLSDFLADGRWPHAIW